ncbi:unnamed protein product [Cuscuta epithymum]|uniref:Uncharacterized protein n=1 Tax=Cuscuta epithymum TaxID=186058 RepID=A0AAV0E7Q0_9ASTE|nr:unnamed protein product [Cuscuta epithymum]
MVSPTPKQSSFHPALAVSNIKNFIPITLDLETVEYTSWSELFKITARAYQVLDHIIPSPTDEASSSATPPALTITERLEQEAARAEALALWTRLDAIVLQWIYGTISTDLLHTIIEADSTAQQAWERLSDIFQDNKQTRAVHLENQFSHTRMDQFPNVTSYCRALKSLADQLANVNSPVDNHRLVLRMVSGLPQEYATVATIIQQSNPLPLFSTARSMVRLEETRQAQQTPSAAALVHTGGPSPPRDPPPPPHPSAARGRSTVTRDMPRRWSTYVCPCMHT